MLAIVAVHTAENEPSEVSDGSPVSRSKAVFNIPGAAGDRADQVHGAGRHRGARDRKHRDLGTDWGWYTTRCCAEREKNPKDQILLVE